MPARGTISRKRTTTKKPASKKLTASKLIAARTAIQKLIADVRKKPKLRETLLIDRAGVLRKYGLDEAHISQIIQCVLRLEALGGDIHTELFWPHVAETVAVDTYSPDPIPPNKKNVELTVRGLNFPNGARLGIYDTRTGASVEAKSISKRTGEEIVGIIDTGAAHNNYEIRVGHFDEYGSLGNVRVQ